MKKFKKTIKKIFLVILLLLIMLGIFTFVINKRVVEFSKQYILNNQSVKNYDYNCAIVLGASVKHGVPSLMLKDRLDQSIYLYNNNVIRKIVMSGDHINDNYNEVNIMKDYVVNRDIPSSDVYLDHYGIRTYDSMYRLKVTFNVDKALIITQEYHLYRSIYIARKLGLEAYGIASNPREYTNQWYRDIREILARVKDYFKVMDAPSATYSTDRIYLNESGDLTNEK